jgi:exopolyphosphatase/guanosine-5'-triphosphate,3'-diphosphate pyrophosphatase
VRLACDLSGRGPSLLGRARLEFKPEAVVLQAESGWETALLGEPIAKRAATLANLLGRELKVKRAAPAAPPLVKGVVG